MPPVLAAYCTLHTPLHQVRRPYAVSETWTRSCCCMLGNTVVVDMHRLSPYEQGEFWYGVGYSEDNFLEGTPSTHVGDSSDRSNTWSMDEVWAGCRRIMEGCAHIFACLPFDLPGRVYFLLWQAGTVC